MESTSVPTEGYGKLIVLPEINAIICRLDEFASAWLKLTRFTVVENDNLMLYYLIVSKDYLTLRFWNVPPNRIVIKFMMFPYSLEGAALIINLDSLNAAAGGNLLSKTTREALNIIENKSKVRYSRNKPNASRMNATSSKTDKRIDKLADQLSELSRLIVEEYAKSITVERRELKMKFRTRIDANFCEEYAPELLGFPNSFRVEIHSDVLSLYFEFILEKLKLFLGRFDFPEKLIMPIASKKIFLYGLVQCIVFQGKLNNRRFAKGKRNELILTVVVTGWSVVCIDYRKLNEATRNDHFPLPFMDQMIETLAGNEFYCFLDGFSGYFQIPIDPQDQEKTTFTCPYGTFAYQRMPFGLCNAPGTFQRCMMAIFHDMIENTMEVFMDDFSVFGDSFDSCLSNLEKMLKRCEDTNLVLNWEKCHFMCKEGIVLGHKISKARIEVDRAKVDVIAKLPHPTTVKGTLKKKLTGASILVVPDWNLPFELMCDASDFAIGAVLGQQKMKHFQPIHYASKTMTEAQIHYTTTEKEMLAVMYAFEKFRPYLGYPKA
ncbi:reverse transcriptase domain-containing protein [Tanacetum coccineum]|uniref:Reverse transcriptase domain-containing protein n=1 Tax=Tanacetum coccineum TaxID=301880 RepID=A0ABQ5G2P3_9ASTR